MALQRTIIRSDQVRQPLVNTTAYWDDHATFIPKKGEIVVYSDGGSYEENGQDVPVPKIKIGDGVTSVWLLHFTDDDKKGAGEHEVVYAECTLVPDIGITCNMSTSEIVELVETGKVVLIKYGHDIYHITSYNTSKDPNVWGLSCMNETVKWIFSERHAGHKLWRTEELSIPTVNDATLTIKKNGTTIDTFSANSDTDKTIDIKVPTNAADVSALPSSTKYAASLYLSVNSSTYVVTAQLKDQDGNNIGAAQTIDLPLESVVVDGSYNPQTKKVVLTLENGSTIEFSVADLVAGLQNEITAENPLSADLVVDGNVNKVFTLTMKTKLDGIEEGAEVNVQSDWNQTDNTQDDYIKNKPDLNATLYEEVTYSQLRTKIDNEQLVEGKKYRITDYVTLLDSGDNPSVSSSYKYKSAQHPFDLVVTATSASTLDCRAQAVLHDGDTYFNAEKLSKLKIWYSVIGTDVEYAHPYNGKGCIYRMVDEFGNDCPYDFHNVMFKRKVNNGVYDEQSGTLTWLYTFDSGFGADVSFNAQFGNNVIKPYIVDDEGGNMNKLMAGTVFLGGGWYNNTIGFRCHEVTIGDRCSSNIIGNDCTDILLTGSSDNVIGAYVTASRISNLQKSDIGPSCGNLNIGSAGSQTYFYNIIVAGGNNSLSLAGDGNGDVYYVYVEQGVSGTVTLAGGLSYGMRVGNQSDGSIRIYNEDDPQVNSDWNATSGAAQILNKPDLDATLYESVTYSQLVTKINNSQLVKGRKYRITDYVTTTTQSNTSSAGHAFDLVVTATDVNKLDCIASALLHSGDTYFSTASADLNKWQIWYDVNNDTSKYLWADSTNGKGVIYRMIDEWGNDCPYDFKNILFTKANSYTSAYTFNKFTSGDTANSDYSLNIQYRNCYENIICEYYKVYGGVKKRNLNFNVFLTTDSTSTCSSNTFECDCYNNTFGDGCSGNTFLSMCYNNTFSYNCRYNVFGSYCNSNTFGNNCFDNSFGTDCYSNIFGNYCYAITLENRCGAIVLGNSSNQGGSYIINVTIKSGNSYVRIYNTTSPSDSNYLKNIYIAQGCSGTSNAYTEISTIARNLSYRTTVGRDSSGNIRIYNEDDPASASQAQANWNETSSSSPSYIQNKPTIPDAQIQSDWNQSDNTQKDYIKNKPTLAAVATSGSYSDLSNRPSVYDSVISFTSNDSAINSFTVNASQNKTIDIPDKTAWILKHDPDVFFEAVNIDTFASHSGICGFTSDSRITTLIDENEGMIGSGGFVFNPFKGFVYVKSGFVPFHKNYVSGKYTYRQVCFTGKYFERLSEGPVFLITPMFTGTDILIDDCMLSNSMLQNVEKLSVFLGWLMDSTKRVFELWPEHPIYYYDGTHFRLYSGAKDFTGDYTTLSHIPVLNTNNTAALTATSAENITGTVNLHKIAKTGTYSDLIGLPTALSDFTNDTNFITLNDVPTEVVYFTWTLSGQTYTSSMTPANILAALKTETKCVIGINPIVRSSRNEYQLYHCMGYVEDSKAETFELFFTHIDGSDVYSLYYDSSISKWNYFKFRAQELLIGTGTGQNIKTINNTSLLGSGNINIPSGDTNVQSDWNQSDSTADDFIKNKPTITDEKVKQTVDATTTEYPLLVSAQSSPTSGTAYESKYSANLKATGEGDVVFVKNSTKCKLQYNSTDLCLNFVFE